MLAKEECAPRVHRLIVPVVFPAGVAPGSGKTGANLLGVARRGTAFVLRGTAIAGVLRHAFAAVKGLDPDDQSVTRWFGHALRGEGNGHRDRPSPLCIADAELTCGEGGFGVRNHNSVDRHTGAVREGGLFSIEALPPGTSADLVLTLRWSDPGDNSEDVGFLRELLGVLANGVFLGGNSARGIGLCRLDAERGQPMLRTFHLSELDGHAAWLDDSWSWRNGIYTVGGDPLEPAGAESKLVVRLALAVPRGQDICVGDDTSLDFQIEPQRVRHANGQEYWRLPGASLRGVLRGWVTRLAARAAMRGECENPADNVQRFVESGRRPAEGDLVAWGFHSEKERIDVQNKLIEDASQLDEFVTCPVMRLFGSLYSAGRLHISDFISTSPVSDRRLQGRKHVAVDRITGGASEGFLFTHQALLAGVRFEGTLVLRKPGELEARWLADTLRALDLGVLRVGSSKSSGRVALAAPPVASGECAGLFTSITPMEPSP